MTWPSCRARGTASGSELESARVPELVWESASVSAWESASVSASASAWESASARASG
ncbi:hypothetical protein [Paraburkholderia sp. BL6665CI2N2]|uniref:hypothetical protein n=1 Tax=Paraburkholderia sp. BL6665CI2N2 TaxID=1938806 RepID=UPI001FBAD9EA|nr:hypothetical protein [Paraburkholderia sp. BL6665CI2N2]